MRAILGIIFVSLMPWMASASHCQIGTAATYGSAASYATPAYQQHVQHYPHLAFPLYGAGYQQTTPDSLSQLDQLDRIEAKLDKLLATPPQAAALLPELPHVAILKRECAGCHSAPNPRGRFTMFEKDTFAVTEPAALDLILYRMRTREPDKHMPPGREVPTDQFTGVLDGFLSLKLQASAATKPSSP